MNAKQIFNPSNYDLFVFDSDGVLIEGGAALPGAVKLTRQLKELDKPVVIFSNNSTTHPIIMGEKYTDLGIHFDLIVNSGMLAVDYLKGNRIDNIFVVGEQGLIDLMEENSISVSESNVKAVVVGMDRTITYEKLSIATRFLIEGVPFIATNPDKTFPTPTGPQPGAGAMIASLSATCNREPDIILGKPSAHGYKFILSKFNTPNDRVLMIGDRFETDILGAIQVGIDGVIVNTGIAATRSNPGMWKNYPQVPVIESLRDLLI